MSLRRPLRDRRRVLRPSGAFSPLSLSPLAWYRSDLGVTVATGVSEWQDQSGNGYHLTQGTGALQPAYNASDAAFGGKPSIAPDGVDDRLQTASELTYGPHTVFKVCTGDGATKYMHYREKSGVAIREYLFSTTTYSTYVRRAGVESAKDVSAGWGAWGAAAKTIRCEFNGTHASHKLFLNNAEQSLTSIVSGNPGSGTEAGTLIVATDFSGSVPSSAKIAELIIFNSLLSAANITLVENYLRTRYGHY